MRPILNRYLFCLLPLVVLLSCSKGSVTVDKSMDYDERDLIISSIPEAVIGDKVPNPLDISVVVEAFDYWNAENY